MLSWKIQRRQARRRDGDQCQICGDLPTSPHCKLQVHHIHARADGGTNDLDNLVTLCDLCHAVCHTRLRTRQGWHMGPAWCGVSALPLDQRDEARAFLTEAQQELQSFLELPPAERRTVQDRMWATLGVARRYS